jgi:hypothetical protein
MVGIGIDFGDSAVAPLVMQSIRRDHSIEEMNWRKCYAGAGLVGRVECLPHHARFELRRLTIADEWRARLFAPLRNRQRLGGSAGQRGADAGADGSREGNAASEQHAAIDEAVARDGGRCIKRPSDRLRILMSFGHCK